MGKVVKAVVGIALAVAVAVFAPQLAPIIAGALGTTATVGLAIATTLLSVAALGISKLLGLTPKIGAPSARATPSLYRQSIAETQIIYGRQRVGGLLTFSHARQTGSGDSAIHYRYFVVTLAGHRIQGVDRYWLGDQEAAVNAGTGAVTSGPYAGKAWIWAALGTDDDVAHATFIAECGGNWTSAHRGRGVAKLYVKFELNDDVIAEGFPNITCEVRGKNDIYDPRTDSEAYSDNAILCAYDWLKLPREDGGYGADPEEEIDWDHVAAEASICDEAVQLAAGGAEKRYTVNGVITTGAAPDSVRDTFVMAMAGRYAYTAGQHWLQTGVWRPQTFQITEDQLRGPITVQAFKSEDQIANEVRAVYQEPADKYQARDIPARRIPGATDIRTLDVELPFTKSGTTAQRIAEILLRQAQAERELSLQMNLEGLNIRALQTVGVQTSRYGLSNYAWCVAGWAIALDAEWSGTSLKLIEDAPDIYEWSPADELTSGGLPATIVQPSGVSTPLAAGSAGTADYLGGQYTATDIDDILARLDTLENP